MSLTAKYGNWIAETTATTGTGNITLSGALSSQYATFSAVVSENDQIYYHIFDRATNDQEAGIASVLVDGALLRTPQATLVNGVYDNASPSAISLSGDAIVYGSATADTLSFLSNEVQARLLKDGSEPMTGQLILSGDATSDLGAVPKQQLDAAIVSVGRKNLIDNGDFTIWQRGDGPHGINTFNADRFRTLDSALRVSRATANVASGNAAQITAVSSTTLYSVVTCVELVKRTIYTQFTDKTFTLSFNVSCREPANFYAYVAYSDNSIAQNLVTVFSDSAQAIPDTTYHHRYKATFTVSAIPNASNICLLFNIGAQLVTPSATAEAYISEVQLEEGDAFTKFEIVHPAEQIARCQRYYWQCAYHTFPGTRARSNVVNALIPLPAAMRTTPAVSNNNVPVIIRDGGDTIDTNGSILGVEAFSGSTLMLGINTTLEPSQGSATATLFDSGPLSFDAEF